MAMQNWVRLPSGWIEDDGLKKLRWSTGSRYGSDNIAALMTLTVIAHHTAPENGVAKVTYNTFGEATGLSRAKISDGLDVLETRGIIKRAPNGQSTYGLSDFNLSGGWCKLPARQLYKGDRIPAFHEFRLRSIAELDALKLYFLFASRRDNATNLANISFTTISDYSGINRERIKAATSLLASHSLAYIERVPSATNPYGVANAYRLVGIDPYSHMGTRGRSLDGAQHDFSRVEFEL